MPPTAAAIARVKFFRPTSSRWRCTVARRSPCPARGWPAPAARCPPRSAGYRRWSWNTMPRSGSVRGSVAVHSRLPPLASSRPTSSQQGGFAAAAPPTMLMNSPGDVQGDVFQHAEFAVLDAKPCRPVEGQEIGLLMGCFLQSVSAPSQAVRGFYPAPGGLSSRPTAPTTTGRRAPDPSEMLAAVDHGVPIRTAERSIGADGRQPGVDQPQVQAGEDRRAAEGIPSLKPAAGAPRGRARGRPRTARRGCADASKLFRAPGRNTAGR